MAFLADDLSAGAANVTVTVSGLEALGWVIKTSDPADRRAVSIQLTQWTRQRMEEFTSRLHRVNDRWFQSTSPDGLATVMTFFRRLITHYCAALRAAEELSSP